jgi:midasin
MLAQQQQQQVDDAVSDLQAPQPPAAAAAAAKDTGATGGTATWTRLASEALKPSRLTAIAAAIKQLMVLLPTAAEDAAAAAAYAAHLSAVVPLLQLLVGSLQGKLCQLLVFHKSSAKLSYICCNIFCSLVCEGYCMPEAEAGEDEGEGGQGELHWEDAGGTGMGEGTGKKDVSDQITNEDQLLGAQQKDQQQQQQQEDQGGGGQEEQDMTQGVEMDADFEGELHDIDDRKQQQQQGDDSGEDEQADDERIDQQMGEVRNGLVYSSSGF